MVTRRIPRRNAGDILQEEREMKLEFKEPKKFDDVVKELHDQYPDWEIYASVNAPNRDSSKERRWWSGDSLAEGAEIDFEEGKDPVSGRDGKDLLVYLIPDVNNLIPAKETEPDFDTNKQAVLVAMA